MIPLPKHTVKPSNHRSPKRQRTLGLETSRVFLLLSLFCAEKEETPICHISMQWPFRKTIESSRIFLAGDTLFLYSLKHLPLQHGNRLYPIDFMQGPICCLQSNSVDLVFLYHIFSAFRSCSCDYSRRTRNP